MESRLEKRYEQLLRSHMQAAHQLAAGIKNLVKNDIAFNHAARKAGDEY